MSAIASHLWISTLVLLTALLLARLLPLTARTRHALILCGLLKFAIPAEAIAGPLRALGLERPAGQAMAIEWLGPPVPLQALAPPPSSVWPDALMVAWIISALALAAGWAIARRRLVSSALRAAGEAAPREHEALAAARRRLSLSASIDVMRSPICEAPAVVRIIRPVIILPDGGCDALDEEELESLLRHECAHVARRDNLLGLIESAVVAVFWFHPLVWIAQRAIGTTREEACDEVAAATTDAVSTYISALSKICAAVLAPRLSGVSCMASAHLKERLNHLMRYESLRARALSHSLVVSLAAVAIVAVTVLVGVDAAALSKSEEPPYRLVFKAAPGDVAGTVEFTGRVFDSSTGVVLTRPHVSFRRGSSARIATAAEEQEVTIDVREENGRVRAIVRIARAGITIHQSTYVAALEADGPRNTSGRRYSGDPISLNLKDAELKNVLDTFAKISGLTIEYPPTLEGRVNLNITGMPWDEALDVVLRGNGLTWRLEGSTLHVVPE